jgi:hypothetical protein
MTKEVAVKQDTSLALPSFVEDAGKGMEGVGQEDLAVPFLGMLQSTSHQYLETIKDAKPGLILNNITNELFEAVKVIPCGFQRVYNEWTPDNEFRGKHDPGVVDAGKLEGVTRDDEGKLRYNGNFLVDTKNHFLLIQSSNGSWQKALLPLSSTQIKKSKGWMTRIAAIEMPDGKGGTFNPPSFSHIYEITPVKEKNKKGSWFGLNIEMVGPVQEPTVYAKAKEFNRTFAKAEVEHGKGGF